jgi:uncharacterized short protein YbdD (DUF466 family)
LSNRLGSSRLSAFAPRALRSAIRRMLGMPDYQRYLTHLRERHPERPLPTEREYYEEFLRARYADGPNRCC